jgi:hypothetical protein
MPVRIFEHPDKRVAMKTYQECIREYDDSIPHKADLYLSGFIEAMAFIFEKDRTQVVRDAQAYRSERYREEEET